MGCSLTRIALLAVVALVSACILPGDLRDLADVQERTSAEIREALEERAAGEITEETLRETIGEQRAELGDEIKEVAKRVEERTGSLVGSVPKSGDPLEWLGWLAGVGTVVLGGGGAYVRRSAVAKARQEINLERDRARLARGELVSTAAPPAARPPAATVTGA